ncbi:serine hydrolase domain-containing protein [Microbacterium sp. LWS13-1.2]|uniref:Beta-lactamase family protein n=1 Tax=Microbacterium sp. LWS13-1.2 TaxID=3135264 RepID=A0AAU6SBZ2_9MICO
MSGYGAAFDWARRHVEAGRLPTAVLGVATADGVVALDAFGTTDGRPARADAPYWLFSITKVLTGLTAARAIERGLLTTETPLAAAVPEFASGREDVVRLRHLVSHTSGIREPTLDPAAGLHAALRAPGRDFAAGAASRYSTVAFQGIAELVRHATGQDWDADIATSAPDLGANGFTLDPSVDPHTVVDAERLGLDMRGFASHRIPGPRREAPPPPRRRASPRTRVHHRRRTRRSPGCTLRVCDGPRRTKGSRPRRCPTPPRPVPWATSPRRAPRPQRRHVKAPAHGIRRG